jgi:hypothetical protein
MEMAFTIFGVIFAAICIWLTVRIVNRRELWAKWTLAMVISLPILYVGSFGPACWLTSHHNSCSGFVSHIYWPFFEIIFHRNYAIRKPILWYCCLYSRDDTIILPDQGEGYRFTHRDEEYE